MTATVIRYGRLAAGTAAFAAAWYGWSEFVDDLGSDSLPHYIAIIVIGGALIGSRWAALIVPGSTILPALVTGLLEGQPEDVRPSEFPLWVGIALTLVVMFLSGLLAWVGVVAGRLAEQGARRSWARRRGVRSESATATQPAWDTTVVYAQHELALMLGAAGIAIVGIVLFSFVAANAPPVIGRLIPDRLTRGLYAGDPWDGDGNGDLSQADIEAFDDFPLFWLGPSYDGYHLQEVVAAGGSLHRIVFSYGSCPNLLEQFGCETPLSVAITPCNYNPHTSGPRRQQEPPRASEDVPIQPLFEGSIAAWIGPVQLQINYHAAPDRLEEVVAALEPIGLAAAGMQRNEPPDFSKC